MPQNLDPRNRHRRSIRLPGYDYTRPGGYFVTIVTHERECLFGKIVMGGMELNAVGKIVETTWYDLPSHYPNLELGIFVIMPNHVHAIIFLKDMDDLDPTIVGAGLRPAPTDPAPTQPIKCHGLPEIVRAFKSFSARRINELCGSPGTSVWQRNYYEHIIRSDDDYHRIHNYIETNPLAWDDDAENPTNKKA